MDKTIAGILFTTLSAACYAIIYPLLKKAGLNPFATILLQISFLWVSILPLFIATNSYKNLSLNGMTLFFLAVAGIVNAVGYYASIRAYATLSIWQINLFFAAISPIVGGLVAYLLLHEPLSAKMFVGLAFILVGLTIAFR